MVTHPIRPILTSAVILLTRGVALAQLPEAPPPHLALDGLVQEYQRFGLPLPPNSAELVRLNIKGQPSRLGFRYPPRKPGDKTTYLIGSGYTSHTWLQTGETVELVKPTPDVLEGVTQPWSSDLLCLAVQCRLRGWNDLATTLNTRGGVAITGTEEVVTEYNLGPKFGGPTRIVSVEGLRSKDFAKRSVVEELRLAAREYWYSTSWADSDRRELLRYLKVIDPGATELIRDLEATVAPRRSRPGSVESLIDDLTEHRTEGWGSGPREGSAYSKLMELGFDAVPALMEHLADRRFTRGEQTKLYTFGQMTSFAAYEVRVGHLASWLLDDLSGGETRGRGLADTMADPQKVREWWEKARKVGEERWLVEHALPKDGPPSRGPTWLNQTLIPGPNTTIYRTLRAKYPERLAEVYQNILRKRPALDSEMLAREIVASKLPRERKVALVEEGLAHKNSDHRIGALEGLAALDAGLFRTRLVQGLKKYPADAPKATNVIQRTGDPGCWDAFTAAAKRAPYEARMGIIMDLGHLDPPDKPDPVRRERIRFLAQLLDDRTAEKDESGDMVEVRDNAASQLGGLLRFRVEYRYPDQMVQHDPNRGPITRFVFREIVRRAAEQELTRLKK